MRSAPKNTFKARPQALLHLEAHITALRVLALAGKFGCFLRIGTCFTAVVLSGRSRTVASRVFAFLGGGHNCSFGLSVLSSSESSVVGGLSPRLNLRVTRRQQARDAPVRFPASHLQMELSVSFCSIWGVASQCRWPFSSRPSLCRTAQTLNPQEGILGARRSRSIAAARSTITRRDSFLGLGGFVIDHVPMQRTQAAKSSKF